MSLTEATTVESESSFRKGNEAFIQGQMKQALNLYTECVDLAPTCTRYLCMRSLVNFNLGNFEEAIDDAETSIRVDKRDVNGFIRKSLALLLNGDASVALDTVADGLALHTDNSVLLGIQVLSLYALERYSEVVPLAREVLAKSASETPEARVTARPGERREELIQRQVAQKSTVNISAKIITCLMESIRLLCEKSEQAEAEAGEEGDARSEAKKTFHIAPEVRTTFGLDPFPQIDSEETLFGLSEDKTSIPAEFEGLHNARAEAHVAALIAAGSKELDASNIRFATQLLENALLVARTVGLSHCEVEAIILLGVAYRSEGKLAESIEIQRKALDAFGPKGRLYSALGNTYFAQHKHAEALELHKKHLQLELLTAPDGSGAAMAHNNIACVYSAEKNHHAAVPEFELFKEHARRTNYILGVVTSCNNIASCYMNMKEYEKCHEALSEAISMHGALYEECSKPAATGSGQLAHARTGYISTVRQTYKFALELFIERRNYEAAFEVAERAKTATWVDALSGRLSATDKFFVSFEEMRKLCVEENLAIVSYTAMTRSKVYAFVLQPAGNAASRKKRAEESTGSRPELDDSIDGGSTSVEGKDYTLQLIPLQWPQDFMWDPVAFASILRNDERDAQQALASPRGGGSSRREYRRSRDVLKKLFYTLVRPLERYLARDPSRPLVVLPHGKHMVQIPWSILIDRDGRHLIESRPVVVASCAAAFASNMAARRGAPVSKVSGVVVFDNTISSQAAEASYFASLGYKSVNGSTTDTAGIKAAFEGAANAHILCRVTCKDVAAFDTRDPSSHFSTTCRTSSSQSEFSGTHITPYALGSLYFARRENPDSLPDFRVKHSLDLGTLESLPSLKKCPVVTLNMQTPSMEELMGPKSSTVNFVRALMCSEATCVLAPVLPVADAAQVTDIMKAITEKVRGLSTQNDVAFAIRDAILDMKTNQVPFSQWGIFSLFM